MMEPQSVRACENAAITQPNTLLEVILAQIISTRPLVENTLLGLNYTLYGSYRDH